MKKTANKKANSEQNIKPVVIDASGMTLGRVASRAAVSLIGKDRTAFVKNSWSGVPVIVQNASKIKITPEKLETLTHKRYSGYPGGLRVLKGSYTVKTKGYKELVRLTIVGMLPKNKLKKQMEKNLTVEE